MLPVETRSEQLARVIGPITIAEGLLLACILLLVLAAPNLGQAFARRIEGQASVNLASPFKQILAVGVFALVARAIFLPWLGPAIPHFHDEYSLLFQAQTFLAGRLANPTPAFWQHFETIHLNVVPAYASMYFPGRSVPLLLGLVLADNAWVGVWISVIALCMAATWMLRAWVAAPFALLGGILIALRLGVFSYWANSYWSGAPAAFAAMLILGAVPRFVERRSWSSSAPLAVGASILLLTRPVEGALLCVPVAVYLLWRIWRSDRCEMPRSLVRLGVPAALLLALSGGWLLSYNKASTGEALVTPYDLNREMYAVTPAFLFSPRPVSEQRGPPFFRAFYQWEDAYYVDQTRPAKVARRAAVKLYYTWNFYVGFILTPAFLAGLWAARRRPFLLATVGFFMAGYMFVTWNFPHYTAPIFPVLLIVTMMGFQSLRHWRPKGRDTGVTLTRAMPIALVLSLLVPAGNVIVGWPAINEPHDRSAQFACCALRLTNEREAIATRLSGVPGRDIVLVSADRHPPFAAIVYNEPNIAKSDIIWAHSLGLQRDTALLAYYRGRKIWQLHWSKDGNPVLAEYPSNPVAPLR